MFALPSPLMPLLASLVGNDFVSQAALAPFHSRLLAGTGHSARTLTLTITLTLAPPAQLDPATLATVQPEVRDLGLPSLLCISFFGAHPKRDRTTGVLTGPNPNPNP